MNINDQKKLHELYAHYWMAMATTGTATQRDVTDGTGRPLTDEELISDAMATSLRHINLFRECAEYQAEQLEPDYSIEAPPYSI